ncbi:hypothetical protein ACQQ2Q_01320 [Agrobacterium sp. ES01]|uniref:hypothetical protein n=1 Tax=Agrobacterium sp. ES01 TaxID=3420714 RepID=UPI003D12C351
MPPDLTDVQKEQAEAVANLVAAAMVRLNREHGKEAVLEAMRLISSAMTSNEWRKQVGNALINNAPPEEAG